MDSLSSRHSQVIQCQFRCPKFQEIPENSLRWNDQMHPLSLWPTCLIVEEQYQVFPARIRRGSHAWVRIPRRYKSWSRFWTACICMLQRRGDSTTRMRYSQVHLFGWYSLSLYPIHCTPWPTMGETRDGTKVLSCQLHSIGTKPAHSGWLKLPGQTIALLSNGNTDSEFKKQVLSLHVSFISICDCADT